MSENNTFTHDADAAKAEETKENKEISVKTPKKMQLLRTAKDTAAGFGIGVAFIIPGFSGGSVAAILGIYERLVGAIADIFKSFKKSFTILLPIIIGLVLGAVSLMFPLEWALGNFPLPTVCLFVGLAIGGLPTITDKVKGKVTPSIILSFIISAAVVIAIAFLPMGADKDLFNLDFGGYSLLFVIGFIGSVALVVPGISGSMLLLMLGYYNPILSMITQYFFRGKEIGTCILVLGCVGIGIIVGFICISIVMKKLLEEHTRGTYAAILGFIIGSIPTIFITTVKDYYTDGGAITLHGSPAFWIISALLLAVGLLLSLGFVILAKKHSTAEGSKS